MLVLAEIADKMPTVAGMWGVMAVLGFLIAGFTIWRWWLCLVGLLFSAMLSGFWAWVSYGMAYVDPCRADIWRELGLSWVVHSIASAFMPLMIMSLVTVVACFLCPKIGSHRWGWGGPSRRERRRQPLANHSLAP